MSPKSFDVRTDVQCTERNSGDTEPNEQQEPPMKNKLRQEHISRMGFHAGSCKEVPHHILGFNGEEEHSENGNKYSQGGGQEFHVIGLSMPCCIEGRREP
ncbi:MAG: hypothetical protein K0S57_3516 [Ramlibacter sp.]|nr:hypothetical protein [Ramlibacter sp.]